jgi:hypothetical protein
VYESIDCIRADIEGIKDDEQESYDNMPESIQYASERAENSLNAIDELDDILSNLDSIQTDVANLADQCTDFEY